MPIYTYRCTQCQKEFDVIQKVSDTPPLSECCHTLTERLIGIPAIKFVGSGWTPKHY